MDDTHVMLVTPREIAEKLANGTPYEIVDLDTTQPLMIVDGMRLVGHFEDILGTDLFFKRVTAEGLAAANSDPSLSPAERQARQVGLFATATKRLVFKAPSRRNSARRNTSR